LAHPPDRTGLSGTVCGDHQRRRRRGSDTDRQNHPIRNAAKTLPSLALNTVIGGAQLTCAAVAITSATDAPQQIDYAIRTALREKKPAYIEIACNIAAAPCAALGPVSAVIAEEPSDAETLTAAIAAAAEFLTASRSRCC
jgi:thiamine pyrophosphate-dependent acetolactate synthase large subunit-like protein